MLSTINPAEFALSSPRTSTSAARAADGRQEGSAWTEEGDTVVDTTIHLGAGDRRQFKMMPGIDVIVVFSSD